MFDLFIYALKNGYAVEGLNGRATRLEFGSFVLFAFLINIACNIVFGMIGLGFLSILVSLALIPAGVCVGVRRLHDLDYSGWFYLVFLIPFVNLVMLVLLLAIKGTEGSNKFGNVSPNTCKI